VFNYIPCFNPTCYIVCLQNWQVATKQSTIKLHDFKFYTAGYSSLAVCIVLYPFSGVGKSSLVHLILKSSAIARPAQTVGCTVGVKVSIFCAFVTCTVCNLCLITLLFCLPFSMLLMEVRAVHLITSVMLKGTSLLSFWMSQDMNDTRHAGRFSIHKSMVHAVSLFLFQTYYCLYP
jgi:hypothetical protein